MPIDVSFNTIGTFPEVVSTVVKKELYAEIGYCRKNTTVLLKDGDEVGLLVTDDGDGTWSPVADAAAVALLTSADPLAIVVDTGIYDVTLPTVAADQSDIAIFFQGPAAISVDELTLGDGSKGKVLSGANKTILVDLFEGQGIKNLDSKQPAV